MPLSAELKKERETQRLNCAPLQVVCELYNSGGIARVFGRPKILEVVHDPDHDFRDTRTVGLVAEV